jgi:hypothetical protein
MLTLHEHVVDEAEQLKCNVSGRVQVEHVAQRKQTEL